MEELAIGVVRMHSPKYWRMRPEEFRTKADNSEFPKAKATLRQVANNSDELAQRAEQIVTLADLDVRTSGAPRRVAQEYADDRRAILGQLRNRMT
jgi:hypothetical protein